MQSSTATVIELQKKMKKMKIRICEDHILPTFSSNFLHAVTFLRVLHLDVLRRQTEIETESLCMAIMLDLPQQSLYTQYYRTV